MVCIDEIDSISFYSAINWAFLAHRRYPNLETTSDSANQASLWWCWVSKLRCSRSQDLHSTCDRLVFQLTGACPVFTPIHLAGRYAPCGPRCRASIPGSPRCGTIGETLGVVTLSPLCSLSLRDGQRFYYCGVFFLLDVISLGILGNLISCRRLWNYKATIRLTHPRDSPCHDRPMIGLWIDCWCSSVDNMCATIIRYEPMDHVTQTTPHFALVVAQW